jgi:hypothetical protein
MEGFMFGRQRPCLVLAFRAAALAAVCLLGPAALADARQEDLTRPVLTASYPLEIKMQKGAGTLDLALRGEHLWVSGERKWTARRMILYIRHTGKDNAWHAIANPSRNPSGDDYPDANPAFGSSDFMWPYMMYLKLPYSTWLNAEGDLEFKLVKGTWGDVNQELLLTPVVTSAVFRVAVKQFVHNASRIHSVKPEYYLLNQQNPPALEVRGDYAFGSVIAVDGALLTASKADEPPGNIYAAAPAALLAKPGEHVIQIHDPQNTLSESAPIQVYGPPTIVNVQPKALLVGTEEVQLTARVSGLKPTMVEARVGYTYSAAQAGAPTGKVAGPVTIPKAPPAAGAGILRRTAPVAAEPAAEASAQKVVWTPLAFTVHQSGDAWFKLPAGWAKQIGSVRVRITTPAGSAEYSLPIKAQ